MEHSSTRRGTRHKSRGTGAMERWGVRALLRGDRRTDVIGHLIDQGYEHVVTRVLDRHATIIAARERDEREVRETRELDIAEQVAASQRMMDGATAYAKRVMATWDNLTHASDTDA